MVAVSPYLGLVGLLVLSGCTADTVLGSESVTLPTQAMLATPASGDGAEAQASDTTDIARSSDGLYYVDADVNGATIRFVVDSGSSLVVLSSADASRAGLGGKGRGGRMQTANGITAMRYTTINSLKIAERSLKEVEAAVVHDLPGVSLMGQSALARFDLVAFRRDRLQLR